MATTNMSRSTLPVLLSAAIIIGCAVMACGKGSPSVTSDAGDPFCDRYRRFTCASSPTGICDSNGLPADPLSPDLQTIFDQRCLASTTDGAIPHAKTDGNTLGADLSPAGKLLWEWVSPASSLSSPALSPNEDRVLVVGAVSTGTKAYSLSTDGGLIWEYSGCQSCGAALLPVSIARNGEILFASASAAFVAINPDGKQRWLTATDNIYATVPAPMVAGDDAAFGLMTDSTFSCRANRVSYLGDGFVWRSSFSIRYCAHGQLALSSEGSVVGAVQGSGVTNGEYALNVFSGTSGERLWSEPLVAQPTGLALDKGNVYLSFSDQSTLMARSLQGTLLWTVALSGAIGSPVVNAAGNILVLAKSSAQKGYLYEVASSTGAVLNSVSLHFGKADVTPCISGDFRGSSSPVVLASGEVVFIGEDGAPYSVSNTGDVRKIIDAPAVSLADVKDSCSTPVVDARGILYYRVLNRLYSVDTGIGAGLASTPWPKQWRDNQNSSNVGASGDVGGVSPPEGGVGDAPVSGSDGGTASPSDGSGADTPVPGSDGGTVSDAQPDRAGVPPDTGVNPGTLTLSPSKPACSATVGTTSTPITLVVTNVGGAPTGVLTTAPLGGPNAGDFAITDNTCVAPLAPLASCAIQVVFKPTLVGALTATLTVTDATVASTPATATLTGIAVAAEALAITGPQDLGSVTVGETGTASIYTVTNTGGTASGLVTIGVTDPQFTIGNNLCGLSLAPAGTCTFTVAFAPGSEGLKTTVLTAKSGDTVSGQKQIQGIGRAKPLPLALSMSPPTLGFGSINVGTTAGPQTFTVTNTGGTASGVLSVFKNDSTPSVGGGSQFTYTTTCLAVFAPGAACFVAVTFSPTIVGSASATITVTDGTASALATMSGTGTDTARKSPGQACGVGAECTSGNCTDNRCCIQSCGVCQACTGIGGVCVAVTNAEDADTCRSPSICNASGSCCTPSKFYADTDGDGYGDKNKPIDLCSVQPGYVTNSLDCDDTNKQIHPGAVELCNLIDDNCDGNIDSDYVPAACGRSSDCQSNYRCAKGQLYCDAMNGSACAKDYNGEYCFSKRYCTNGACLGDFDSSKCPVQWVYVSPGYLSQSTVVVDDRANVLTIESGMDGNTSVISLSNLGDLNWKRSMPSYALAIAADGHVVSTSGDSVSVIDNAGNPVWTITSSGLTGAPTVTTEGQIIVADARRLHCFNIDGSIVWEQDLVHPSQGSVSIVSGPIVSTDGSLFVAYYVDDPTNTFLAKIDRATGRGVWSSAIGTAIGEDSLAASPGGSVYVASGCTSAFPYTAVYSYDGAGKLAGFFGGTSLPCDSDDDFSPTVGAGNIVYLMSVDWWGMHRELLSIDMLDLQLKWTADSTNLGSVPAIDDLGSLWWAASGMLNKLNPDTGMTEWDVNIANIDNGNNGTLFRDGTLYLTSTQSIHMLLAWNTHSGGLAQTPWPMFRHDYRHTNDARTPVNP